MHRMLVPGGVVAVSVWDSGRPHGLFTPLIEVLVEAGLPEPFSGAYEGSTYNLTAAEVQELLDNAGFKDIQVETRMLAAAWPDFESATASIHGTPFGPAVAALPAEHRDRILGSFAARLAEPSPGMSGVRRESYAHVGVGTA
jgi:hypothetical protein